MKLKIEDKDVKLFDTVKIEIFEEQWKSNTSQAIQPDKQCLHCNMLIQFEKPIKQM